ncbi:MAG: hypothetical protein GX446_08825 [Chthonomonadales bacterium]|nr:hypothetical protein [Chthonomonadales bacterium]
MSRVQGTLRADRRTKNLIKRVRPGDIAVIHHADLDAMAARSLAEHKVGAVVNATMSITGRYPNQGPALLVSAGIPVLDNVGEEFFGAACQHDGTIAAVEGNTVRLANGITAEGCLLNEELVRQQMEAARANLSSELDAFARNTLSYLAEEKALLLDPVDLPELTTPIRGRHVLVVVRGEGYREDLRAIQEYLRDVRPAVIGVDGGADALLEAGVRPDIIFGDMDSVSDTALRCGAELVVHGYAKGGRGAPGMQRLMDLGLPAKVFHVPGTSEDAALLLADGCGASVIVAVGTHFSLMDFLDKGRGGMASTFLVRLRIGSKLVDAKGIGRLWMQRRRPAGLEILAIVVAALFPIAVISVYSPFLRTLLNAARLWFQSASGMR